MNAENVYTVTFATVSKMSTTKSAKEESKNKMEEEYVTD